MSNIECGTYGECPKCGDEYCCMCEQIQCTGCVFEYVKWEDTVNGQKGLPNPYVNK